MNWLLKLWNWLVSKFSAPHTEQIEVSEEDVIEEIIVERIPAPVEVLVQDDTCSEMFSQMLKDAAISDYIIQKYNIQTTFDEWCDCDCTEVSMSEVVAKFKEQHPVIAKKIKKVT
jgi:hypothetical protein